MAKKRNPFPNTGSEPISPRATRKAVDRPLIPPGGPPGRGARPRHAAGDPGSQEESYGPTDTNEPQADKTLLDETDEPQNQRTVGRSGSCIRPGGVHRGDSTIGANPNEPSQ